VQIIGVLHGARESKSRASGRRGARPRRVPALPWPTNAACRM